LFFDPNNLESVLYYSTLQSLPSKASSLVSPISNLQKELLETTSCFLVFEDPAVSRPDQMPFSKQTVYPSQHHHTICHALPEGIIFQEQPPGLQQAYRYKSQECTGHKSTQLHFRKYHINPIYLLSFVLPDAFYHRYSFY